MSPGLFEFGPFRFDATSRVLWRGGAPVRIAPKALDVLAVLLARPGEVVDKAELLRRAWPDVAVEEANISVNVSILRRALEDGPEGRPWIETVARRGYRFAGALARVPRERPKTLAVLPFRTLGETSDGGALGLAMADALITRLSASGRVLVRPTSAIQKYAHQEAEALEVARVLQVDAVLEGRLQQAGSRLRVSVQLIPADAGAPLWADDFEEDLTHLFAAQDAVAARLAAALALEVSAEPLFAGARRTRSVAAYEAYSRGRFFWSRFDRPSLEKGAACFQEAVTLDPAYGAPHAGLADAFLAAGFAGALPPRAAWEQAEAEADRAAALDPNLPEAWISRGFVRLLRDWDWRGAEECFRQAVDCGPGSAAASQWHGLFQVLAGRTELAEVSLRRARALDPASALVFALEGLRLSLQGDHESALRQQRRTVELDPHQFLGRWALGTALQNVGRHDDAAFEHRLALDLASGADFMRPVLARSLALAGRAGEARALLAGVAPPTSLSAYQVATVHLALGETEPALEMLEAACAEHDPWAVLLPLDPMLASLRGDPRAMALARRVRG